MASLSTETVALPQIMTPQYAAPEILRNDPNSGTECDIYSFGIVM